MHLAFGDVAVDSIRRPSFLQTRIKQSKTDPFRNLFGMDLCPVAALLDYMTMSGSKPAPLFVFSDGHILSRARYVPIPKMDDYRPSITIQNWKSFVRSCQNHPIWDDSCHPFLDDLLNFNQASNFG